MTNLRDIRNRLRSVENIKKITNAMERIAGARLRRAQTRAEQSHPYITKLKEILENLASTNYSHPLFEQREVKKTGFIVISADRGLSGSYNQNILSSADHFLKKYTPDNIELILLGRKAIEHYRGSKWTTHHQLREWGGKITLDEIKQLTDQLVDWFLSGRFDEIWLSYTHYITVMRREVIIEKFLNIGTIQSDKKPSYANYIFEPGPEEVIAEILPRYCFTRLQTALYEAYASELAARVVAMQMASKNSENMIEDLTLIRNKVRQEGITREIIEVSSANR